MLHDASLDLLTAPLSENVDDTIDPNDADQLLTTSDGSALVSGGVVDTSDSSSDSDAGASDSSDTLTYPTNGSISTYTVQAGDNLSTIAQNYGVTVNTILWANDITDPSTIKEGTKLVILPVSGIQHTVRAGETLSTIAENFGADAGDIAQFNGLPADGALVAGSTIIIPGGELPSSSSAKSSSSPSTTKTTTKTTTSSGAKTTTTVKTSVSSGSLQCDMSSGNPCHGIDGPVLHDFFTNPLPSAHVSQGLHGWDAVDLSAPTGSSIMAAADGTVILSRMGGYNGGYGNYVILDNGSGVETLYAHMSQTRATVGETVSAGEVIGYVGMTGDATGPHLHFEVRGAQNPFAFCAVGKSSSSCL